MRIVYVLTSLGMGGAERQVIALAERMAKRGHAVVLLVLRPRLPAEWPSSLETIHLDIDKSPGSLLRALVQAKRFLQVFHPDLLHGHSFHGNLAARLFKLFDRKVIVLSTVHNVYEGRWPRMLAYRLTDPFSDRTTAVSDAAATRFVRLHAVPQRKCTVIANGIDETEFAPRPGRRQQLRFEMGVEHTFVWLTAGRVVPAKDYPNLLRAFASVHASIPDTQLWIAGDMATAEAENVRSLALELGLGNAVRWLGLRRDMPTLLDAADAFVLGSAWEGMPLALGEAMAMQKPVVATDVGGVRQLVGDEAASSISGYKSGSIVPARDPGQLARAMQAAMLASPEHRNAQGIAARQRIVATFSMNAKANEWEALYRSVLL